MQKAIKFLLICCLISVNLNLSGCGGSGSGGTQSSGVTAPSIFTSNTVSPTPVNSGNSYSLTEDTYGLQNATFMSATEDNGSFVLRAALASGLTDPDFVDIFRIDILQPTMISGGGTYSLGGSNSNDIQFPGAIVFFNGHKSTLLNTTSGSITFTSYGTSSGDVIAGSFAVLLEDQNSTARPVYSVKGNFSFVLNTSGVLVPTPSPVPTEASVVYDTYCASCHSLGNYDPSSANGAPDLALKGGEIANEFTANLPGHNNITLSATEISDLKILLNAN